MVVRYYYLVMSQIDMLENQVLEEILRERAAYYYSKDKSIDFWLSISPSFLEDNYLNEKIKETNFYTQQKKNIYSGFKKEFYSCIISTDKEFISWLQLRLGYFENINESIEKIYVSDGIFGFIDVDTNKANEISPLKSKINQLNPEIVTKKYKKILELYYMNN